MFLSCFLRKRDAETEQLKQQRRKHDSDQRKQKQNSKVKQTQDASQAFLQAYKKIHTMFVPVAIVLCTGKQL